MSFEWIGWVATAAFAGSYLFRGERALRAAQAAAALLWVAYGLLIGAKPVVASNIAVAVMAVYSIAARPKRAPRAEPGA